MRDDVAYAVCLAAVTRLRMLQMGVILGSSRLVATMDRILAPTTQVSIGRTHCLLQVTAMNWVEAEEVLREYTTRSRSRICRLKKARGVASWALVGPNVGKLAASLLALDLPLASDTASYRILRF